MAGWLEWVLAALIALLYVTTLTVTAVATVAVRRDKLGRRLRAVCSALVGLVGALCIVLLFTVPGK